VDQEAAQLGVKAMRCFPALFLLAIVCAGCESPADRQASRSNPELRKELRALQLKDGVSRRDAVVIGRCYFARNVGCGYFTGIGDGGDHWIVEGAYGYTGSPLEGLFIDKRTGKITQTKLRQGNLPGYDNPLKIFP
jgi:hypothetical protein